MKHLAIPLLTTAIILGGQALAAGPSFEQREISAVGWSLAFVGSSYDAPNNTTTFTYRLTANTGERNLGHWVLALSDAPLSTEGCSNESFGLDPTTGVYGWKCGDGQTAGTTQTYSIKVGGHMGEAPTEYSVKGGTYFAIGPTTGPGAPIADIATYSISGFTFLDMNGNGTHDGDEPPLANVTVTLSDGQTVKSDGTGYYLFSNLLAGSYTIDVPGNTPSVLDDFNESLDQYFAPTTDTSLDVTLAPNAPNQNFGFTIDQSALLDDLNPNDPDGDGVTLSGTGKGIGFWKHQIASAKQGKSKGIQVMAATLNDYLFSGTTSIRTLFTDPFSTIPTSTPGAYDYALGFLTSTSSSPLDLLKKQLFACELNHQAGWGLNDQALQGVILAGIEYQVKYAASYSSSELLMAKEICDRINNTGE